MIFLTDFICNRKQTVVLNDQHFSWVGIKAGVSQISILGPLLLLVYMSDLMENLYSNPNSLRRILLYSLL